MIERGASGGHADEGAGHRRPATGAAQSAGGSSERGQPVSLSPTALKVRATLDLLLVMAAVGMALVLVPDPYEALLLALALGSGGLVWFVGRRERDMSRRARSRDWQGEAIAGRGISLADWHRGAPLAAWSERRREPGDA